MRPPASPANPPIDRRRFLTAGVATAAAVVLGACAADPTGDAATTAAGTDTTTGTDAATPNPPGGPATAPSTRPGPADPAGPAPFIVRGPAGAKTVALTFHTNGDLRQVKAVLDIVEKRDAVITAFIVGNWLDANPSMGRRLLDGGSELANHTYTHPAFDQLSPAAMQTEIARCRDAIAKVSGNGGRYFRLSGADDGTAAPSAAALLAAGRAGYVGVAGFDVDPLDYKDPGARAVIDRTLQQVEGGSIISLHMGHAGTIDAMGPILDGLAKKDLKPVTLTTLLA